MSWCGGGFPLPACARGCRGYSPVYAMKPRAFHDLAWLDCKFKFVVGRPQSRLDGLRRIAAGEDKAEIFVAFGHRDQDFAQGNAAVSYTHLRAHETDSYLVCRLL